jgi:hypothetical protein
MSKMIWLALASAGLIAAIIGHTFWMIIADEPPNATTTTAVATAPTLGAVTNAPASLETATAPAASTAAAPVPAVPADVSTAARATITSALQVEKIGLEYAAKRETSWRLFTKQGDLTGKTEVAVRSLQKNEQGAFAEVEGACKNGYVVFSASLFDSQSRATVTFPWSSDSSGTLFVATTARINDNPPSTSIAMATPTSHRNQITLAILFWTKLDPMELLRSNPTMNIEPLATTWRALVQFDTSMGTMLTKIPVYDESIQRLIKSCSSGQSN